MHRRIRYLGTFLPHQMRREIKELYLSTILMNLGLAMVQMFEPIYLYSIGYSLQMILLFYGLVYGLYLFIIPLGAKFVARYGSEKSIVISTVFIVGLYLALFAIPYYSWLFYVAAVLYALQKMLYWPAFHADFAQNAKEIENAREISTLTVATSLLFILGPILAGALILLGGYGLMFLVVSIIFLLSNVPLLSSPEKFIPTTFSYRQSFSELFSLQNRRELLAYMGFAEEFVALVIWPIFIAVIIGNDFTVGVVIGATVLLSVIVTLVVGKWSDHHHRHPVLRFGTIIYAFSWFIKLIVRSVTGIFFVGSLSWLAKNIISVALTSITYSRAKRSQVLASVVRFESGLVVGKLAIIILLSWLLVFFTDVNQAFTMSFIVAGLASLLYLLL